jgi:hypothetical protein
MAPRAARPASETTQVAAEVSTNLRLASRKTTAVKTSTETPKAATRATKAEPEAASTPSAEVAAATVVLKRTIEPRPKQEKWPRQERERCSSLAV